MIVEHHFHEDYCATGILMTTHVEIVASHIPKVAKKAFEKMRSIVNRLNRFDSNSELFLLNNGIKNEWVKISSVMYRVLDLSLKMNKETSGVFTVDFEGREKKPDGIHGYKLKSSKNGYFVHLKKDTLINLGGIGKGFIVDEVFEFIKASGSKNILVNAGGDLRATSQDLPWKIGLKNPYINGDTFACLNIKEAAVVSSGIYARPQKSGNSTHTHFYNIKTKSYMKQTPYSQVTIQGYSAAVSEVYAKCIVMGTSLVLGNNLKGIGVDDQTKRVERIY
ncbi:FAD:protein FMN transferase [bacterium]|nr:FAD:protein FMN transferase [bacterium]